MSESVARSGNKTLYVARSVVELLSQCVVFMAFAAMIILGVVKKSDEYILYAALVTIPVVITFFARKYITSLFLFVMIHIVLIAAAIMLGRTDAESTAYFVSVFVVCVRSVSVRKRIIKRANINDSKLTSFVLPFCPPNVLPTIITMQYTTDILSVVCITAFFSSSLTSSVLVLNRDSFIYSV